MYTEAYTFEVSGITMWMIRMNSSSVRTVDIYRSVSLSQDVDWKLEVVDVETSSAGNGRHCGVLAADFTSSQLYSVPCFKTY
jgi:hypothetical protein